MVPERLLRGIVDVIQTQCMRLICGAWKRLHRYPNRVALSQIVLLGRLLQKCDVSFYTLGTIGSQGGNGYVCSSKALENFAFDVSRAGLDECMRFSPLG